MNNNLDGLVEVLANTYTLFTKTLTYHWNVTGQNFISIHQLFGDQYDELLKITDRVAERLRALDKKVPALFMQKSSIITLDNNCESQIAMIKDLHDSNVKLSLLVKKVIGHYENDDVTTSILTDIAEYLDKSAWSLQSSLS